MSIYFTTAEIFATSGCITCGLDSTMHASILDYVKSRLLEDMGQVDASNYYRRKYEVAVAKKPSRRSGVRVLSVPKL